MEFFGPFTKLSQVLIDDIDKWLPYDEIYLSAEYGTSGFRYNKHSVSDCVLDWRYLFISNANLDIYSSYRDFLSVKKDEVVRKVIYHDSRLILDEEGCWRATVRVSISDSTHPDDIVISGFFVVELDLVQGPIWKSISRMVVLDILPKFGILELNQ